MNIAIIGSGNVGGALAINWKSKGHSVTIGARNPNSAKVLKLKESLPNINIESIEKAISDAQVVLIAATSNAAIEISESIKNLVQDKIIIDAMNSVGMKPEGFNNTFEAIKSITQSPNLIKCFNTTGAENMANPSYPDSAIDMFMAGNSSSAKAIVRGLALDAGFAECHDFGGDEQVQILENFAMVWINLALKQGKGRNFGFKILTR